MYAVIMAGGGGTRLHPLSRPERPKPFLPLLSDESLLQATERRLRRLTDDITVVTESRYERLVRDQLPDAALLLEPMGRNTAAAIALATIALDRPPDDVMLVVPADAHIDPAREDTFGRVLEIAAEDLATGAFEIDAPLVTLGTQVIRPAVEYGYLLPDLARGADIGDAAADPRVSAQGVRGEAQARSSRGPVQTYRRRRLERGHVPLAPAGDPRRAACGTRASSSRIEPMFGSADQLAHAYEAIRTPLSIDHAVMESAARNGEVAMASMDVGWSDLGSWSALLGALGARGEGAVVQAGETVEVGDDDLVVRRVDGRLGVIAPPERGSMTATQPIAVLRGSAPDIERIRELIDRCSQAGG